MLLALPPGAVASTPAADQPPPARWVISSGSGHAILSFTTQANGQPDIMFICGASHRGLAQVLVFGALSAGTAQNIRIEVTAGDTTVLTSAEPTDLRHHGATTLIGSIEVQHMRDLIQSSALELIWRVKDETGPKAARLASIPPALGRQRGEFLRFCD